MTRMSMAVVIVGLTYPSLLTWLYFVALAGQPAGVQQMTYLLGKCIQFSLPVVFALCCSTRAGIPGAVLDQRRPGLLRSMFQSPNGRIVDRFSVLCGALFGICVGIAMAALYALWLKDSDWIATLRQMVAQKLSDLGLNTRWKYAAVGVFYMLAHSLLEEYYWRWFVFRTLRGRWPFFAACAVSSLGFMAHHVILLSVYFGWTNPGTYVFSLAVASGGVAWAWMYERSGNLIAPWLSHALVDAAIFALGYRLAADLGVWP